MKTKVENMTNGNGNSIPNQFIIQDENGNRFFQSYNTIIAKRDNTGKITLDKSYWDYSKTTSKYRNQFLGEDKKATQAKIDAGIYKLEDLN